MKKNIFFALAIFLLFNFISCKTTNNKPEILPDYAGIYTGIIPSAGGDGINVKITLNADETYTIEYKYIGKSDSVFSDNGKFIRNTEKDIVIFEKESENDFTKYYKLGENTLTHLDLDGNIISGEFADNYILKKEK
ncbi:MAG: copper resistance protein NlpE [Chitinivibrionia bacterium]|nr:copper resistance protein NlpE [Chitinivibrionia bacterium]